MNIAHVVATYARLRLRKENSQIFSIIDWTTENIPSLVKMFLPVDDVKQVHGI